MMENLNNSKKLLSVYDCTLRDGIQMSGVNFSSQDKFLIVKNLIEELSIPYIEIYPFSNPKDRQLIQYIKEKTPEYLDNIVAFGSTRKVKNVPSEDPNLQALIESGLNTCTIVGKASDFQLQFINATPEQNLQMIEESIGYLKEYQKKVFFDAEHFFDGFKSNKDYAIRTIRTAERVGADRIILCDTNGGTLPFDIYNITKYVLEKIKIPIGIHAHNDCGMGDANALAVIQACFDNQPKRSCQIQGTMNGFGERAGNTNLITILPILILKMDLKGIILSEKLHNLTSISNLIYELSNLPPSIKAPFVGYNAFSHKGGMHIAAMEKDLKSYEHIDPSTVGNKRNIIISEMSGRSAILHKCKKFGIDLKIDDPLLVDILKLLKRKESHGYNYDGAEGSLEILLRGMLNDPTQAAAYYRRNYFEVDYFRVITDVRNVFREEELEIFTDANIKTLVLNKEGTHEFHTAADGNGPVNALDRALRKALIHFYPVLNEIELIDYKVRITNVLEAEQGTASRVRVLVESRDKKDGQVWGTIGSHVNIIVASFVALIDSYVFKLLKENAEPYKKQ